MTYFSLFLLFYLLRKGKTLQIKLKEIEEQLPKPDILKRKSKPSMKLFEAAEVRDEPAAKKKVSVLPHITYMHTYIHVYTVKPKITQAPDIILKCFVLVGAGHYSSFM